MTEPRKYWRRWAEALRRYQLHEIAAALLEAGGPLPLLGAQALYVGGGLFPSEQLTALANTLEEEEETQAFVALLASEKAAQ